jgi:hypothetical protein
MSSGVLADLVVFVHVLYVAYVVLGQVAILIAGTFRRQWGRNPWFRFTHLAAILVVVGEEIAGVRCPLTVWEERLREMGGQVVTAGQTFVGRLMHDLLFLDNVSQQTVEVMHFAFGALILESLLLYPPRWFRRAKSLAAAAAGRRVGLTRPA